MKRSAFAGVKPARRVRDLALPEAIDAVARFTGPPEDPVDAAIARALATAPDGLAGQARLLRESSLVLRPGVVGDIALSADGARLAVQYEDRLLDIELPGGRVVGEYERRPAPARPGLRGLVHLGDSIAAADLDGARVYDGGRPVFVAGGAGCGVTPCGDGFAALRADGVVVRASAAGAVIWRSGRGTDPPGSARWIAGSPDGERVLAGAGRALVVLGARGEPVLSHPGTWTAAVFTGADRFVMLGVADDAQRLSAWRITGDALEADGFAAAPYDDELDVLEGTGLLITARERYAPHWHDAQTLESVDDPGIGPQRGRPFPRGGGGRIAVVRGPAPGLGPSQVEVLPPPVYALLHVPLGSLGPGDVDELDAFLEPGGSPVLEFLRALLAGEAAA
ncbi:hypothetical protein [Dactylosporangium sp. NPDC049140]|uniref:hypothetical protein n=1 Tax=Dactylosporangium sp. NPDC049140 TaxID=3155647 RepID=UPI00340B6734